MGMAGVVVCSRAMESFAPVHSEAVGFDVSAIVPMRTLFLHISGASLRSPRQCRGSLRSSPGHPAVRSNCLLAGARFEVFDLDIIRNRDTVWL